VTAAVAVAFGRVLRGVGIGAPVDSVATFASALSSVDVGSRDQVYWAARSTLVRRPEDFAVFDEAFAAFWESRSGAARVEERPTETVTLALDDGTGDETADGESVAGDEPVLALRWSGIETLRNKDFATFDEEETRLVRALMEDMRLTGPSRPSERRVPTTRRRGRPDVRRTVRASLATGADPIRRKWTRPGERSRRLVLLLDVSGSMEPYARALVRFVHAAVAGRGRVEAFTMGTRLTRVTRELSSRDPDRALSRAGETVADWSGGTRLGETIAAFNDRWGARGMARGAVVVILSDGWDRGDPALLAEQMGRLSLMAHLVIWVNPLKFTPGYAPLARGMAAALPYVDRFVEGHSVAALEELLKVIDDA
jgi:hypothetical protein